MIRLLILFDVEGWAYHSRAVALQKYAPPDFDVTISAWAWKRPLPECDLIFNLDYSVRSIRGTTPVVMSYNSDSNRRSHWWDACRAAGRMMICNNRDVFDAHGRQPGTCCIANGVDTDIFYVRTPIDTRNERIFWTGSANPAKGKGYEILCEAAPKLTELGFYVSLFPVHSATKKPFTQAEMVHSYNSSGYVVCLSDSEGTPNTSVEGMACGCCLVTTRVGNALEFGRDGENCVFVERSVDWLIDGLVRARENRIAIATAGADLMRTTWSYGPPGNRAKVFYDLFRRVANREVVEPFSYDDVP